MSEADKFGILAELGARGLSELEPPTYADFRNDLIERMELAVDKALLDALPEKKLAEVAKMAEQQNIEPALVAAVIDSAGIDRPKIIEQTLALFEQLYLATMRPANSARSANG